MEKGSIVLDVSIGRLTENDVTEAVKLMFAIDSLAMCEWENLELFRSQAINKRAVTLAARIDNQVIGSLVGGGFGRRGMICHAAVAPHMRGAFGVGRRLFESAVEEFRNFHIERIHLIVTAGNTAAREYWKRKNFVEDPWHVTLERDLHVEPLPCEGVFPVSKEHLGTVHQLLKKQPERTEWCDESCLKESIQDPNCVMLCKEDQQGTSVCIGGAFGFRAQISSLIASSVEHFFALLNAALERFRAAGIYRIHTRVSREDPFLTQWFAAGFSEQVGETTLELALH